MTDETINKVNENLKEFNKAFGSDITLNPEDPIATLNEVCDTIEKVPVPVNKDDIDARMNDIADKFGFNYKLSEDELGMLDKFTIAVLNNLNKIQNTDLKNILLNANKDINEGISNNKENTRTI